MQELYHSVKTVKAINPATITATANGLSIDLQGFHQLMFVLSIGAVSAADGSNYLTFTVEEADDDGTGAPGAFTAAADSTLRFLGSAPVLNATTQANTVIKFGVSQIQKRWIRLVYTETGTFSALFGAVAILGQAHDSPVA